MTILQAEAEQMVMDCMNRESKLTEWEASFLDDIQGRLSNGYWLTDKQKETIGNIWDRVTENG